MEEEEEEEAEVALELRRSEHLLEHVEDQGRQPPYDRQQSFPLPSPASTDENLPPEL